ncbi:interleukin-18 receptor accessory protein [Nannospalax galili]|uniref:Interleukin-18 receptor accessory protein n=1 Tax=Nannospalax galili TaxID=1026970 RepID=A0A8C6QUC7_NANGA|nr:interleukin-18 receptor accessory protein [Nannospalax galili]XP_029422879.1 interleukin-18 receptor accessory protein [Nannospalax galili]
MFYLVSMFFSFVAGEKITGFSHSDCFTKKLLWTYSARSTENTVIFCDLPELQKSHFSHRDQVSPTQGPAHPPCSGSKNLTDVQWYMQPWGGGPLEEVTSNSPHSRDKSTLYLLASEMDNLGTYICKPRIRRPQDMACCIKTILEFQPQTNVSCGNLVEHKQDLLIGSTGSIYCPSLGCQSGIQSPEMTWYKNGQLLPQEKSNPIIVDEVYHFNRGMYICDYTQSNNVSSWTVRAAVQVRTVVDDINLKPAILEPIVDTVEVELGKPLTLPCKVQFGFQRALKPVIRWYIRESAQEWEIQGFQEKSIKSTLKDKVIEYTMFLEEVTERDLGKKFVCFAQNSIGNTTQIIKLKEKKRVLFLYILLGTIMVLVSLLVAGAFLYTYWIEMVLLCRTYWSKDETLGDKKEFDAFVSYAKCSSFESEAVSSPSEEHLALKLFPEVLENKYGYSLCLLERDVPPGGVYADDIVNIIKTSRRGVFILSPNYVNGPHVFELQAAVNLALADQTLKLILIKFCDFQEPESLPLLVRKALRVLPTVTWKGLKSVRPSSRFWTQMCYHMPIKNSSRFMWNQLRIFPRNCFHWKGPSEPETTGRSSQLREWQENQEEPLPLQPPREWC